MPILRIKDENGNFVSVPAIQGEDGKSAYEQAVEGGYKGTEEEFIQTLANLGGGNPVQLADNAEYEEHIANKNNPHGVTAAQVGALPVTGGQMKASIGWNDGKTSVVGQGDGNFIIRNYKLSEEGNDDFLAFHNTLPLQNVLRIYRNGTAYDVYGKHNKPTASDVGAVSKNGDTLTGGLVVDKPSNWGQYVINAPNGGYRCFEASDDRVRIDVRDEAETTNRRYIDLFTNPSDSRMSHALRYSQVNDGATTTAYLLHTENINDFVISKGSYTGANSTSKSIPIRKTTQMVIVYTTSSSGDAWMFGTLIRGMTRAHCNLAAGGEYSTNLNVSWTDTKVTFGLGNADPKYSWDMTGATYHYVVVG